MILAITSGLIGVITISCSIAWYTVVPPSEAHVVVTPTRKMVCSSDLNIRRNGGKTAYFKIPSQIPFFGRQIRIMDLTNKELKMMQETIERGQARYKVKSSLKYRIDDVSMASERFVNDAILQQQLIEIVQSGVRVVTIKYDVQTARAEKLKVENAIKEEINKDLSEWGLVLVSFQLVDFQDTEDSKIVTNISKRREVEIETQTRQEVAERNKAASIKESAAKEESEKRRIEQEEQVSMREQNRNQKIQEAMKLAEEKRFDVVQVQIVKQANIDKEKAEIVAQKELAVAIIDANKLRDSEKINKEQKQLAGEGDRIKAEAVAKGFAATMRENGLAEAEAIKAKLNAEAEGKTNLQKALDKFTPDAINAMIAQSVVAKDEKIGVATADALKSADVRILSGGSSQGIQIAELIESVKIGSPDAVNALANRISRPNELVNMSGSVPVTETKSKKKA